MRNREDESFCLVVGFDFRTDDGEEPALFGLGQGGIGAELFFPGHWSFAYSDFAAMRMGMSGSASFQSVRKF